MSSTMLYFEGRDIGVAVVMEATAGGVTSRHEIVLSDREARDAVRRLGDLIRGGDRTADRSAPFRSAKVEGEPSS